MMRRLAAVGLGKLGVNHPVLFGTVAASISSGMHACSNSAPASAHHSSCRLQA
ncbi:hypothetical protein Thi970DRAFT_01600 [Thiorhodovibrio frisius]|uniref:Uncharacterized protein n=1 Tax=Thiorhodovibrio frisius TaxID=631362 RepID=H8Z178_9GAMM|nr:hypothetical protein Thi970DRAFT_01600 [Thiorhodovibrio frisius]WPL23979.1 hypothetical protein Thiofri_04188 [Thiorhodovibrio frisius]